MTAAGLASPGWAKDRRKRMWHSVFQTDASQPTPYATPVTRFPDAAGHPFGASELRPKQVSYDDGPSFTAPAHIEQRGQHYGGLGSQQFDSQNLGLGLHNRDGTRSPLVPPEGSQSFTPFSDGVPPHSTNETGSPRSPLLISPVRQHNRQGAFPAGASAAVAAEDQIRFDHAWHVVTSAIALPPSATADDSFGTLPPESQYAQRARQGGTAESALTAAVEVLFFPERLVPRAMHTGDVVEWHVQQVRQHFATHVRPLLAACAEAAEVEPDSEGSDEDSSENGEEMEMDGGPGRQHQRRQQKKRRGSNHYEKNMIVVMSSIRTLEGAMRLYFYGATLIARGLKQGSGVSSRVQEALSRFQGDVYSLLSNSAPSKLLQALRVVLVRLAGVVLGFPAPGAPGARDHGQEASRRPTVPAQDNLQSEAARRRLSELLDSLCHVGLAGENFEVLFAEVMDGLMSAFASEACAGVWATPKDAHKLDEYSSSSYEAPISTPPQIRALCAPSYCTLSLCDWVENHFARLAHDVLTSIRQAGPAQAETHSGLKKQAVALTDVKKWQETALGRLASIRTSELFDMVLAWPASRQGLDDLRITVTTRPSRLRLTDSFSATLKRRLLHPGRSTLEILQTYIAMIRAFHHLDQSKVLLGKVAPQLQLYLCQREDAVRIVVSGLLASEDEIRAAQRSPSGSSHTLVELAQLLNDPTQQRRPAFEDPDLDWADMDWVPDPVDAGDNYRRPRSEDVIGMLIDALGSPEVFIKEFQAIMAERLLSSQRGFAQEVRVLQLLKRRFGEAALQHCDVMMKDIRDSAKLDAAIRRVRDRSLGRAGSRESTTQHATPTPTAQSPQSRGSTAQQHELVGVTGPGSPDPDYRARILSRLFWPNLARDKPTVPIPIGVQQKRYELGYEHLKSSRKLTWLDHLGQASVELDLQDRSVVVECTTYEATVIHAFTQDDEKETAPPPPARHTVRELEEMLQMDGELLQAALHFWVGKGILRRGRGGAYSVVETLDEDAEAAETSTSVEENTTPSNASAGNPVKSAPAPAPDKADPRRAVYWQFVKGMLTNTSAQMPLAQIAMMLKVLIEGFAWSNEELQDYLMEKVAEEELEVAGGKFRLLRKTKT